MPVREELSFLILVLSSGILVRVQAQQGPVLTSTGEPCFGETVTLTCTHPDPFQDPDKYQPVAVGFIENGGVLDFLGDLATQQRFTQTRLNSTASNVSFAVTEGDHADGVITCSCFLALKAGGREESDPITMDVEETIQPPTIVSKPNSTSGLLQWDSPSSSCSNYQYIFNLTWVRIGDGSTGTVSTAKNMYNLRVTGGNYTASITAKIVGLNLDESEPLNVTPFTSPIMTVSPQNVPATAAEGMVSLTALAAVSAVAGLFLIISMVLSVTLIILVGVLVRMRRRRREEGQERKRRDPGEANVPPVPMTTNPSYAQVQHSTEKKMPLYGNL